MKQATKIEKFFADPPFYYNERTKGTFFGKNMFPERTFQKVNVIL